ncbi:MAG: glycosyltransferase family 39 protein [Alphaproteobacteria bacterium]|nr:glycosyltransferase family 39 protein [Alphaproteobacteria bacterium]
MADLFLSIMASGGMVLAAFLSARLMEPGRRTDLLVALTFVHLSFLIVVTGLIVEEMDLLASLPAWAAGAAIWGGGAIVARIVIGIPPAPPTRDCTEPEPKFTKAAGIGIGIAALALGVVLLTNLVILINVAPHNWDSMTYHLARMAFFLQHGNLDWYPANYWAQVDHPQVATIINAFFYLVFNQNENAVSFVQFISQFVVAVAIYGISTRVFLSTRMAGLGALLYLLMTNVIMESTTTQNDLVLAAFCGTSLLFFLQAVRSNARRWLLPSGIAAGLALGTKATALPVLVALAVIGTGVLLSRGTRWERLRFFGPPAFFAAVGAVLIALPLGYYDNLTRHGNPFGSPEAMAHHAFGSIPFPQKLEFGAANTMRLTMDLVRVDGLPNISAVRNGLLALKHRSATLLKSVGVDMVAAPTRAPPYDMTPNGVTSVSHEDLSYFGPVILLLVIPGLVIGFWSQRGNLVFWSFVGASVVFVLIQAFSGPYDPWRGRHFTAFPLMFLPAVLLGLRSLLTRRVPSFYVLAALFVISAGAVNAVYSRSGTPLPSSLEADRIAQLTLSSPEHEPVLRKFEEIVPIAATVGTVFHENVYEYPFFGKGLTRQIVPLKGWPHPDSERSIHFLLYRTKVKPQLCDIALGQDFFLRDLSRDCLVE